MVKNFFFAIILIPLLASKPAFGQRNIGVKWEAPRQFQKIESDLNQFSKLGISYLQVDQSLDKRTWQRINTLGFKVYGMLPVKFPVSQTFSQFDSTCSKKIQNLSTQFNAQPSVKAIGAFSFGDETDTVFQIAVRHFVNKLQAGTSKSFYFVSPHASSSKLDTLFNFKMLSVSQPENRHDYKNVDAYLYRPSAKRKWALAPIKKLLRHTGLFPNKPVFFEASWLQNVLKKHPDFAQTLILQTHSTESAFPLPAHIPGRTPGNSIIALMLLLLWIIFAVTYNFNPVYRKSFLRYFTGHSFFVDDVINRHIRDLFIGSSILIQHCISGGIILYCTFCTIFSELGYEALYTHYPGFSLFGTGKLAFFIWGFIFTLITEIGVVLWLWLTNPKANSVNKIINLYPWPLQLNLITATLITAIFLSGNGTIAIYLLAILFILLFNSAFIITCLDMVRYAAIKKHWYFTGTLGVYLLLIIAVTSWIMMSPAFQNILNLAVSLP